MTTNIELRKIAEKYLGQGGAKFRKYCGLSSGAAWCNAYVDYIAYEGGVSTLYFNGRKETYCPSSIKWCRNNLAQVPLYMALPMDIIYFDWEKNGVPNHIGFVREKKDSSSIYTIEGNTDGGKVAKKTRAGRYVQGVFRPHFKGSYTLGPIKVDGDFSFNSIANLQKALKIQVSSIFDLGTVRALQRRVGVKDDGVIGPATARAIQSKLCGFKGKDVDGVIGPGTVKGLQTWINKTNGASTEPTTKPPTPTKKPYSGSFPAMPAPKIVDCTRSVNGMRKRGLLSGDYTLRFKSEDRRYKMVKFSLATASNNKITYSDKPQFKKKVQAFGYNLAKVKALKTSANCSNFIDGAVGAVTGKYVRDQGAKHNKTNLAKTNYFYSYKYNKGALLAGDICGTSKHTWTIIQGVGLSIGCEGAEVKKLQSFLNWAGYSVGTVDGDFGNKTLSAVKKFQKDNGLTADGVFGSKSLQKAKSLKR